jgi:hypothetical protein
LAENKTATLADICGRERIVNAQIETMKEQGNMIEDLLHINWHQ